jgi:ferrous-iron efflux pump FieF
MRLATYASVTVASVLIVTKFAAWVMTDSVSLLSTLIDSLLDVAASGLNLIAVHHALQPADFEHRYGHGKAEALAGLGQAAFISGSAAFLLIEAGQRIFNPKTIDNSEIGIAVMVVAIALTVVLVAFQRYVVRKTGSLAIGADSLHYQTDVLVNASVPGRSLVRHRHRRLHRLGRLEDRLWGAQRPHGPRTARRGPPAHPRHRHGPPRGA